MNASEKYEDILQYELNALKEIRKNCFKSAQEYTRHIDFVRGTALGLTLGIVCNLFIQFLYPGTKAILLGEYKPTFIGNLMLYAISLTIIIFISANFRQQLTRDENKLKSSMKSVEVIEYAIKRRQHILEQRQNKSKASV